MNVSAPTARRWILVSMVLLLGMAAYKGANGKAGDVGMFKRLWGVGMLGLMLSALADFVPQLAGPFSLLVVLGYATDGGDAAIQNVLGKVSGSGSVTGAVEGTPKGVQVSTPTHPGTNP